MDTRTLFQKISQRMRTDFEATAQITHNGNKGMSREAILRGFLSGGRLPKRFGIGTGEIIGQTNDTSRQCDIVIYDLLHGVSLLYDDTNQVFPIDCVYGVIEVKSSLSKSELFDALDKIASVKEMAPKGSGGLRLSKEFQVTYTRSRPFGMLFAYELANNSLRSLLENLREWEGSASASLWPNYICVLGEGVIYHRGKPFEISFDSAAIGPDAWPVAVPHEGDSLFEFYCVLHDFCANMTLAPVQLRHYYNPLVKVGRFRVGGIQGMALQEDGKADRRRVRFTEAAIKRIVDWCQIKGATTYREVVKKQYGQMLIGEFSSNTANREVYLYDPDNLPGLHEIGSKLLAPTEEGNQFSIPCLTNAISIEIDGKAYIVALSGFTISDYEDSDII